MNAYEIEKEADSISHEWNSTNHGGKDNFWFEWTVIALLRLIIRILADKLGD